MWVAAPGQESCSDSQGNSVFIYPDQDLGSENGTGGLTGEKQNNPREKVESGLYRGQVPATGLDHKEAAIQAAGCF
jgi:hypothetical protein